MQLDAGEVRLPPPAWVGVIVKDREKSIEYFSAVFGIGTWETFEYYPEKDDMMAGEPFGVKVAYGDLGSGLRLQLLEPIKGNGCHMRFLKKHGEGLFCIAYQVSNFDEMASRMQEHGGRVLEGGRFHGLRWCYVETEPDGILIEFEEKLKKVEPIIIKETHYHTRSLAK